MCSSGVEDCEGGGSEEGAREVGDRLASGGNPTRPQSSSEAGLLKITQGRLLLLIKQQTHRLIHRLLHSRRTHTDGHARTLPHNRCILPLVK